MDLWMDISRDDDGEVMSVVVGCARDNRRSIFIDIAEAKQWLTAHHDAAHPETPTAVEQRGCPVRPQVTDTILRVMQEADGPVAVKDIADDLGRSYKSVYALVTYLAEAGRVQKIKAGRFTYWTTKDAA